MYDNEYFWSTKLEIVWQFQNRDNQIDVYNGKGHGQVVQKYTEKGMGFDTTCQGFWLLGRLGIENDVATWQWKYTLGSQEIW